MYLTHLVSNYLGVAYSAGAHYSTSVARVDGRSHSTSTGSGWSCTRRDAKSATTKRKEMPMRVRVDMVLKYCLYVKRLYLNNERVTISLIENKLMIILLSKVIFYYIFNPKPVANIAA